MAGHKQSVSDLPAFIILPARQHEHLVRLALSAPAEEVCALLGGRQHYMQTVYPVRNVSNRSATEFLLEAEGQVAAMKAMREAGESLRGIFHSHPSSTAEPSAMDSEMAAYPDVYYLILSLLEAPPELRAFYFDGHAFHPVEIRNH